MRIGEFSKLTGVTQDAIRHYIEMGLLAVKKDGYQYRFTVENRQDMEKIGGLKRLNFSLAEIQGILCYHRLEGNQTDDYSGFYLSQLERKKEEIVREQQRMYEINSSLNHSIQEMESIRDRSQGGTGFPLPLLGQLCCPGCNGNLSFNNGRVEFNQMIEALIECACGYRALIEDGIFCGDRAVDGMKEWMPAKVQFLASTSPQYINFIYDGLTTLLDYILFYGDRPKRLLELDPCPGRFLMRYLDLMPNDSLYMIVGYDQERLAKLKHSLKQVQKVQDKHIQIVFFCCNPAQLPLVAESLDAVVDHGLSRQYAKRNGQCLTEKFLSLIKKEGILAGAYAHSGERECDYSQDQLEALNGYNGNRLLERLEGMGLDKVAFHKLGPIIEDSPYVDFRNEEQYLALYAYRKAAASSSCAFNDRIISALSCSD